MASIEEVLAAAVAHHRAGRLAQAKALYDTLLERDGGNINILQLSGQAEQHGGNPSTAIERFRKALGINPGIAEIHAMLGSSLRAAGRNDEAEASFRQALSLAPAMIPALQGLGTLLCAHGGSRRLSEVITLLGRVIALDPGQAEVHHDRAIALRQAERLDEAIAGQWQAIALKPDFTMAFMAQANFLNEEGERDRALACIRRAMALAPTAPEIYYNHGNIQHTRGESEVALSMYRRAARIGMAPALVRAAAVLVDLGRLEEAEADLRQGMTLPGADVGTMISQLTHVFIQRGRLEEGFAYFTGLVQQSAADGLRRYMGECLTAIATLQLQVGQPQDASRLLARVVGDSSHLFTVKSIAALRVTLAERGVTLARPANPDPGRPRIGSSTLATHGRFAHNVLEYILVRLYAEKYGYVLETPEWVGGYYFEIDDPLPSGPLRPLYFPRRIVNRLVAGTAQHPPVVDCDIFSPLFLFEHKEEYRARVQSWLKPRPVWAPNLDPAVERLRALGDTIVAIHIRRGDFVTYKYPITQTAWYVDWLRSIWDGLKNPVLFLASDDLEGVRNDFAAFHPVTRADIADAWPGLEYLQEFHVLMKADIVGISAASGFSLLAARLNTTATLFVEPDVEARRIRPFAPWTP